RAAFSEGASLAPSRSPEMSPKSAGTAAPAHGCRARGSRGAGELDAGPLGGVDEVARGEASIKWLRTGAADGVSSQGESRQSTVDLDRVAEAAGTIAADAD
ncbi:MAG: hypothetical protein ACLGHY_04360, partial [Gammaproteobacteria bacterium]